MFGLNPNFVQELIIWGSILFVCLTLEIATGAFYAHIFIFGSTIALILSLLRVEFDAQAISFLVVSFLMVIKVFFRYQNRIKNRPNPEGTKIINSLQTISRFDGETETYSLDASGFRWEVINTQGIELNSEVIVKGVRGNRLIVEKK